ncbi:hypothetical protein DEI82_13605 [Curtobacterium sp. MCBD17_019]|nr:hypothetical protein DEI86_11575 [Curtobacterium sp. MCBD17_028]PZE73504.1 hypothetical protein DEI82_13605 [Curtobacterium sp. MCBD17_019]
MAAAGPVMRGWSDRPVRTRRTAMPTERPDPRPPAGHHRSGRRQWAVLGAVAVGLALLLVLALTVVLPHADRNGGSMSTPDATPTPTRVVATRRTAAEAFPGGLAVQPTSVNHPARSESAARTRGDVATANALSVIADQPIATWLTGAGSTADTVRTVRAVLESAQTHQATPTFVLYAVPDRDCGGYSKGGLSTAAYGPWVRHVADAMRGSHAVVLVEPDSLAQISNCPRIGTSRIPVIRQAVHTLVDAGLTVYLDGGNEDRVPVDTMARRLREAGVDEAQGFSTNVSNFYRVDQERAYADRLADRIGGDPHFVIDVSRNGRGWLGTWCNPPGAGLGQTPHVTAGSTRLDALLWVKTPGLSDGTCNGGPAAGQWWQQYALDLVEHRKRD